MKKSLIFILAFFCFDWSLYSEWIQATSNAAWGRRRRHASVVYDNKMWVMGGYGSNNFYNDVWYSTNGVNWIQLPNAGWGGRDGHTSVVYDNKIWVMGGYYGGFDGYYNDVWYSTNGVNWIQATPSAPWAKRAGHTSVVYDNKMWVMGGYYGYMYNDVWYSTNGVNWILVSSNTPWAGRYGHTSVVYDNKIWVMGGYNNMFYFNDVWYSTDGVNWIQLPNAGWSGRFSHTSVVYDNKMWVMGGYGSNNFYNDVWYSTDGVNWIQLSNAGWSGRYGPTSVVYDNKMWVMGGYGSNNFYNDVWYYSFLLPQLVWTGETGYETDGVEPDVGTSTTVFTFRIKYFNDDPPQTGYPKVYIKKGAQTILTLTLNYISGYYDTGAIYSTSTLLSPCSYYSYIFEVYDVIGATASIAGNGPDVRYAVSGCVYQPDQVTPFPSATVKLMSDISTYTVVTNTSGYFELTVIAGHYWTINISSIPPQGSYGFSPNNITFYADSNKQYNFYRIAGNPRMEWTGEPGYLTDGVEPNVGASTQVYTFRIKYIDNENDPPKNGYPRVRIRKGITDIQLLAMNYVSGNYPTGAIYSTSTLLSPCSWYSYVFETYDVWNASATNFLTSVGPDVKAYITGTVKFPDGTPMESVTLTLQRGLEQWTQLTNASGTFLFSMLDAGQNYTLTPSSYSYYLFSPPSISYTPLLQDITTTFWRINRTTLTWTGEMGYESDGLNPELDTSGGQVFTYRIKYTDLDSDPPNPNYPRLRILKGGTTVQDVLMNEVDPADQNYLDGKLYYYQTTLTSGRDYSYYFIVKDTFNLTAQTEVKLGPIVSTTPPQLVWTGENGYTSDGVEPDVGLPTATYYFRIKYVDGDNDPPKTGYPKLHIKKAGIEISGSPFTMLSTGGTNYINGVVYYYNVSNLTPSVEYTYYFETYDEYDKYSNSVELNGPVVNTPPQLTWTGESGYTSDGVEPDVGCTLSTFTFRIKYIDADNHQPASGYPKVYILKDGQLLLSVTMQYVTGMYPTGAIYSCDVLLSTPSKNYSYYFVAYDVLNSSASTSVVDGPDVSGYSPTLSYTGENGYQTDAVEPDLGSSFTTFYFRLKYTDADNDPPDANFPKVYILKGGTTVQVLSMNYVSGNYNTGAIYSTATLLSPCSYYVCKYESYDCWGFKSNSITHSGPQVQALLQGRITWPDGSPMQDLQVNLTGYATQITTTTQQGIYSFFVTAGQTYYISPYHNIYSFSPTSRTVVAVQDVYNLDFVRVGGQPVVFNCSVTPSIAVPGTYFTFKVVYRDFENDPPKNNYPVVRIKRGDTEIIGSPFVMSSEGGSDFISGVTYYVQVQLNVPSQNYQYRFEVYDVYDNFVMSEYFNGPVVNTPPQLTWTGESGYTSDGVEPDFGTESTTFYFKIVYIDADNHPPVSGYPKLYILKQNDVVQTLTMQYQTGLYTTGAVYTTKTCLPLGEYNYYFVAKDIFDEQSNILYSSKSIIVNGNCKIELLSYPTEIEPNEDFVVYIKYTDIGADPPDSGYPKIVFYLNNELIHTGVMEYVQGSFGTGAVYVYSIKFSTVSANYSFVCYAKDNTGLWPVVQTTTNSFVVSTLPTKPTDLTVYQDNNYNVSVSGKITLKWNSTDPDPDSAITYQLYFGDNLNNMKKIYEGTNTEYTIYNLEDGKTYYWYVVAIDNTGRKSQSKVYSFNTISVDENKVFNYPNPVNAKKRQKTNIVFYSDTDGSCEIYICTLFGEIVFKDTIQVYKGSNVYEYTPEKELKSGSYVIVVKIGNKIKKGYILVLNK